MPRNLQRDTVRANDKTKLRDINGRISVASATYHWEDPRNRRTDDININQSMCGVYDGFEGGFGGAPPNRVHTAGNKKNGFIVFLL